MSRGDLLPRIAANVASGYASMAAAVDRPVERHHDLALADLGLPVARAPNNATGLAPITGERAPEVVGRCSAFFAGRPGGGWELWSAWPTANLAAFGLEGPSPVPSTVSRVGSGGAPRCRSS